MAGRARVLGQVGAFVPGAAAWLLVGTWGCSDYGPSTALPPRDSGASGGFPGAIGATGVAGSFTRGPVGIGATGSTGAAGPIGVGSTGGIAECVAPATMGKPVFVEQQVNASHAPPREFFSWTTDPQAVRLRADRVLFSEPSRPGTGAGYAFQYLQQLAQDRTNPNRAELARVLGGTLFENARYAWPEPWANRLGFAGEDFGRNLLRIVLKPEAWVVMVRWGEFSVSDLQNQPITLAEALANPTRIGAILYEKDGSVGGPPCSGSDGVGSGYREFILGNLAMISEWSIGTQQIRDRLSANIAQLSSFFERIRVCPVAASLPLWNSQVVCRWGSDGPKDSEVFTYEQSLAFPSDNYLPVVGTIAAMIDTLKKDLFEPDPLLVIPGSP